MALAVATAAPARDIAGTLGLPEGFTPPDGAEIVVRIHAPDAPVTDLRRPATPGALTFALTTTAQGPVTVTAALHAEGQPLLAADPVIAAAGNRGPVSLALVPAILPGSAAPFRCGKGPIGIAPDPAGLVLHQDGAEVRLAGPPGGPFAGNDITITRAGNQLTLTRGLGPADTCLPDIPAPVLPLSASGTDPVWSVAVSRDAMALALADGATELGQAPDLRPVPGGLVIFAAPDMNLTLGPGPCADTGTGAIFPFTASFAMPGLTLTGCGGDPALALRGNWTVTGIGGVPIPAEPPMTLAFDGPSLTGDTGCNSLTAPVAWDGGSLRIGPSAATRRACPDPAEEADLLAALPTVTRAVWDRRLSVLRLLAKDAPAITLARPGVR